MATTAQFSANANVKTTRIGLGNANTWRDGSGVENTSIFKCWEASTNGSYLEKIVYAASGTLTVNTAGILRFFIQDPSNLRRLWREVQLPATTPSASAPGVNNFSTSDLVGGLILPNGHSLWVSSHYADSSGNQFDICCLGGNF